MKHQKIIIAIVICAIVGTYLVLVPIKRIRQNNASVAMLRVKGDLVNHVRDNGTWPRSWDDLYPPGMEVHGHRNSRTVIVNWSITIEEMLEYVEQLGLAGQDRIVRHDSEVPFIVRYTDRVPRGSSLTLDENLWNDTIAKQIHIELTAKRKDADGGE